MSVGLQDEFEPAYGVLPHHVESVRPAYNPPIAYIPYMISSLIAYTLASHANLRICIALQQAPTMELASSPGKSQNEYSWRKFGIVCTITAVFLLVIYIAFITKWGYMLLGFPLFLVLLMPFFSNAFGWATLSAHHSMSGAALHPIEGLRKHKRILIALSIVVSIGALVSLHFHTISSLPPIVFAAWIYNLSGGQSGGSRVRFIFQSTIFILLAFVSIIWNALMPNISKLLTEALLDRREQIDYVLGLMFDSAFPAVVASLPGLIITTLLHFDYQKHLEAHPETAKEFSLLETVPAPGTSKTIGPGVVVPSRAPRNFRKTYYHTALAGWAVGQLIVILIYMVWAKSIPHTIPTINIMMHLTPVSLIIMLIFVSVTSFVNGDVNKLAGYREVLVAGNPRPVENMKIEGEEIALAI